MGESYSKKKGGVLIAVGVLLFLLVLIIAGIALVSKGKVLLSSKAADDSITKTKIYRDFGLSFNLTSQQKLRATWNPAVDAGATSFTLVIRDLATQVIPTGGKAQVSLPAGTTVGRYVFSGLSFPTTGEPSYSLTIRTLHQKTQTIYVQVKNFRYIAKDKIVSEIATPAETKFFQPFGVDSWWAQKYVPNDSRFRQFLTQGNVKLKTVMIFWAEIEPTRGQLREDNPGYLRAASELRDHCHSEGYQCVIQFDAYPGWAVQKAKANGATAWVLPFDENVEADGKTDSDHYAAAAAWVIQKFGQYADGIEVLNEPDFAANWGGNDDVNGNGKKDFEDYAELVKKTKTAVAAVDANFPVLMGRLAADPGFNIGNAADCDVLPQGVDCKGTSAQAMAKRANLIDFLENVLKYTYGKYGRQYFDYLDIHYYEWDSARIEPFLSKDSYTTNGGGIRGKTFWARGLLNTYGAVGIPILYSEMGKRTRTYPETQEDLDEQAGWVFRLYAQGLSAGAEALQWYCFFDTSEACSLRRNNDPASFDLLQLDYSGGGSTNISNVTPKPAFTAYKTMAAELGSYTFNNIDMLPGIEGYIFSNFDNLTIKEVLWSRNGANVVKGFPTKSLKLIPYSGSDGAVTIADGKVCLSVNDNACDRDGRVNYKVSVYVSKPVIAVWQ